MEPTATTARRCVSGHPAAASPLPPPPPPPSLPLPSALMPPKKRRLFMPTPRKTATPPPPPPAPLAIPAPPPTAPPPTPVVAEAEWSPPDVDEDDDAEEPSTALPPVVVDDDSAAGKAAAAAERKVRKVVKKVIVKKVVPKGTFAARAAAAAVAGVVSSSSETGGGGETPTENPPSSDQGGGVGNGKKLEESDGEKPATDCNAVAVAEESAVVVGEGATSSKPATEEGEVVVVGEGVVEVETEEEEAGMSERQKRMTMEVFVGGLHRDANEEDVREAFGKAGDITDVRMIMSPIEGKNKGYCFVRFCKAAQAKKAIADFGNVKICGKRCRAAAPVGNDRIFLGNINKKWKKEDVIKLLKKIGIENIDSVTLKSDSNNPVCNRGFAFLELETSRDTWMAYRKLSRKNAFGGGLNINVAWAEPLYDPEEKDMQVKSIFVDGIPTSWDHAELKEIFKKHGKIESVVLSRDMQSAKRKDFAFINYITHEAATSCLESFDKEEFTENGSKVNIKVSLARPVQQSKQIKEDHKSSISWKSKMKASQIRRPIQDYSHNHSGEKRPFSTLGNASFYPLRGHSRPRHEGSTYTTAASSYGALPPATAESSPPHYHGSNRHPPSLASYYGLTGIPISNQVRKASSHQLTQSYGSRHGKKSD